VALLPDEEVSMRHLCHFLGRYDKYLILSRGATFRREGFKTVEFPRKFFGTLAAHNHLLFWPGFYRAFEQYEYILIYHLDSLVFSDELMRWCRAGWDYIGPPWLPCPDTPWVKEPRVGNGGFTLMKIRSVLQVLRNRYRHKPATYWIDVLTRNPARTARVFETLERVQRVYPRSETLNRVVTCWQQSRNPAVYGCNNDLFWSFDAVRFLPTFKIAPVEEGLRFAFEAAPRVCFELNRRQLPFGCHAWPKYDRTFWEPYLLPPVPRPGVVGQPAHQAQIAASEIS
jgi:hypothetical protein